MFQKKNQLFCSWSTVTRRYRAQISKFLIATKRKYLISVNDIKLILFDRISTENFVMIDAIYKDNLKMPQNKK